jgi:hypothetical protein
MPDPVHPFDLARARQYHASLDAYASARLVTLENGAERGVRVIEMRSGGGLEAEIVVDRSFDIGRIALNGETLSWHAPHGYRHPALIDPHSDNGQGFLRGMSGFLATCGFDHIRQPETDENADNPARYPLHGMGAHQPAQLIGYGLSEHSPVPHLWCEAEVTQSMLFQGALRLRRRIEMPLGGTTLTIRDCVENIGPQPLSNMMLYHFNMGYPLVDEHSTIDLDPADDLWSSGDHDPRAPFGLPQAAHGSELSVHQPRAGGICRVTNPRRGLGLSIGFDTTTLPYLQLLRLRGAGTYMIGVEPCTAAKRSRNSAKEAGQMPLLAPGQSRDYALDIDVTRFTPDLENEPTPCA